MVIASEGTLSYESSCFVPEMCLRKLIGNLLIISGKIVLPLNAVGIVTLRSLITFRRTYYAAFSFTCIADIFRPSFDTPSFACYVNGLKVRLTVKLAIFPVISGRNEKITDNSWPEMAERIVGWLLDWLAEWLLETSNLSLMSNKSIFITKIRVGFSRSAGMIEKREGDERDSREKIRGLGRTWPLLFSPRPRWSPACKLDRKVLRCVSIFDLGQVTQHVERCRLRT